MNIRDSTIHDTFLESKFEKYFEKKFDASKIGDQTEILELES